MAFISPIKQGADDHAADRFPVPDPTAIIDSDHPLIAAHAEKTVNDSNDPMEKGVKLYYAVRDGIWYDPYYPFYLPEQVR